MMRQRRVSSLLALLVCLLAAGPATGQVICGDCDGDAVITVLDALLAAQIAALVSPTPTPHCFPEFDACNVNGTACPDPGSVIDVLDALVMAQYAAQLPVPLACGTPLGAPPSCTIQAPLGGTTSGDVPIDFDTADPDSPSLTVTVRYSTTGPGGPFSLATAAASSPAPYDVNPTTDTPGAGRQFMWDTVTDLPLVSVTVDLEIEVDDGLTASVCTTTFDVDNLSWQPCAGGLGTSVLLNPGFETGDLTGWNAPAFFVDPAAHDGAWAAKTVGNNFLEQSFSPVPVAQITRLGFWASHPTESSFASLQWYYSDGTSDSFATPFWQGWTYWDLTAQLNPAKSLVRIRVWGYVGAGAAADETMYDSFDLCVIPP